MNTQQVWLVNSLCKIITTATTWFWLTGAALVLLLTGSLVLTIIEMIINNRDKDKPPRRKRK